MLDGEDYKRIGIKEFKVADTEIFLVFLFLYMRA